MANYILDDSGYFLGIVDNELATHTKITELLPEFTDTQRCKWDGSKWIVEDFQNLIDAKIKYDALEYARNRQPLYPAIGDQLDDLYHAGVFSAEMTATLKKVKDDNPK